MTSKVTGTLLLCVLISLQCSYISSDTCGDAIVPRQDDQVQSTCMVWGGLNLKTFNGNVFSYKSTCGYTLASTKISGVPFEVIFKQNPYSLFIKYNGNYEIKLSGSSTVLNKNGKIYNIPTNLDGIKVSQPGSLVIVRIQDLGMTIKWDKADTAEIIVDIERKLELSGLCGRNDGCKAFDMVLKTGERTDSEIDFADSWSEGNCKAKTSVNTCKGGRPALLLNAETFCKNLFADAKFKACQDESAAFMNLCTSNYCSCTAKNRNDCMCEMLDSFVRTCRVNKGLDFINWRDANLCQHKSESAEETLEKPRRRIQRGIINFNPLGWVFGKLDVTSAKKPPGKKCTNPDQEYMSCAPNKRQLSCGEDEVVTPVGECEEGCYCPQGFRLFKGKCLLLDECPCVYENRDYLPGATVPQECNTCTCKKGLWSCTDKTCTEEANCWGDPHYTTFDGKKYDFMGKCMYYVVRGIGFDVICDHYVLKGLGFVKDFQSTWPSWCRRVIVKASDEEIELGQKHEVKVNGRKLTWLPRKFSGILISQPSSEFVSVQLENNVVIKFNGEARVIVTIPTSMKGRVKGLFGTYTKNPADDFQLPNGTIVADPNIFGHSWKVPGSCSEEFTGVSPHPCVTNAALKPLAEKACSLLKTPTFAGCSKNPQEDYESCLYDACSCTENPQKCACDPLAIQSDICAKSGKFIEWRQKISECAIKCPAGQEYKVCGNACARSCDDIAFNPKCQKSCIEGCSCPEGQVLNEKNVCVPVSECKCKLEESFYPPGFKCRRDNKLLTCTDAKWTEKDVTDDDKTIPDIKDLAAKCKPEDFLEFTGCKASNPVTCHNMHKNQRPLYDNCKDGCQCVDGFVLDTTTGSCTRPDDCPCLHNGISFEENAIRRDKAQKCTCKNSEWECVEEIQPWEKCSVWGNIHIRMFSGLLYSFKSNCEYTLFEDISEERTIRVTMKSEECSTGSCIKHVKMLYSAKGIEESIQFSAGAEPIITGKLNNLLIISYDVSTMVEVKGIGMKLLWVKYGWMHLHVKNSWKAKRQYGLCGSYTDLEVNDFVTPEGTGVSYLVDSWKLNKECPKAVELPTVNVILPDHSCDAIFDDEFQECRAVIPIGEYYNRCLIDGNFQLLTGSRVKDFHCSTLSTYAQECNDLGVPVKWRKQDFCPIECQEGKQYNQCISTKDGVCYEGCEAKKDEGHKDDEKGDDEHTIIKLVCKDAKKPCKKTVEINIEGDGVCIGHNQFTLVFNVGEKSTAVAGLLD